MRRHARLTGLICVFMWLSVGGVETAFGQATSAGDAATLAGTRVAEARKTISVVARPEAAAALEAADKAAKAATAAANAAAKVAATAKNAAATLETVKADAGAAAKAAQAAATAASDATSAAATAAATITIESGKAVAGKAMTAAFLAAKAATAASEAAGKANTTVSTAEIGPAKTAAATVAAETEKVAFGAAAAAAEASEAALAAVAPPLPVTGPQDEDVLAALRARITGGSIFFNGSPRIVPNAEGTAATVQSSQFSQAAIYLAFEAQPRLWSGDLGFCGANLNCKAARERTVDDRGYRRLYVDPFVNVRLTVIPVTGSSPAAAQIQVPDQTFLQSQKAVQLQLGAMTGLNFGKFQVKTSDFHWGFGPVSRFMFQSVTDSQRAVRVWDIDNDLFKLRSLGVRLTLYEKDQQVGDSVRQGWAPAAYIDVSRGSFENFQTAVGTTPAAVTCLQNTAACLVRQGGLPAAAEFAKINDLRWYIEGRVFLQYLYLGFDLNNGPGPDDLRFIGGLTVRLDQFFKRTQ